MTREEQNRLSALRTRHLSGDILSESEVAEMGRLTLQLETEEMETLAPVLEEARRASEKNAARLKALNELISQREAQLEKWESLVSELERERAHWKEDARRLLSNDELQQLELAVGR